MREMVQNSQKTVFFMLFRGPFGGHLGAIWARKKIKKGSQVEGIFGPMSELKD
jgi:hypothetical protein